MIWSSLSHSRDRLISVPQTFASGSDQYVISMATCLPLTLTGKVLSVLEAELSKSKRACYYYRVTSETTAIWKYVSTILASLKSFYWIILNIHVHILNHIMSMLCSIKLLCVVIDQYIITNVSIYTFLKYGFLKLFKNQFLLLKNILY